MMLIASIALELAIAAIAVLAARERRPYLYGLAFTFAVYVLYDTARLLEWHTEGGVCCHGSFSWRARARFMPYGASIATRDERETRASRCD